MDDVFKAALTSMLLTLALAGCLTRAAELEYISQEQTQALAEQFSSASEAKDSLLESKKNWTCDMYGVRSRLQVQRGVKLYEWESARPASWKNSGAQPVAEYRVTDGALKGKTDRVEDHVRVTRDGHLLSRLSLAGQPQQVLAYSVCKAI